MRRLSFPLILLLLCGIQALPIFTGGNVRDIDVYRIWESMKDPAPISIQVAHGMLMQEFLDRVRDKVGEGGSDASVVVRSRSGMEITDLAVAPPKVFVLVGGESYFYPVDTIGEEFKVPVSGRNVTVEVLSSTPRLVLIKNFLTDEECDSIIDEAKPLLQRSKTVAVGDQSTGNTDEVSDVRTSSTAWMMNRQLPIIKTVDSKVQQLTSIDMSWAENMQVLHYGHKQHYHVHHDFFNKDLYRDDPRWSSGHNRIATVFFYLTTVEEGGETIFPYGKLPESEWGRVRNDGDCDKHDNALRVNAVRGSAIIFYHVPASKQLPSAIELDKTSLHGGCDPIVGDKWAANYWLRNGVVMHAPEGTPRPKRLGEYGLDESWPGHHLELVPSMFGDVSGRYRRHMFECGRHAEAAGLSRGACEESEAHRMSTNMERPRSVSLNFTRSGLHITKLPQAAWTGLERAWTSNKMKFITMESTGSPLAGNAAYNLWASNVSRVPLVQALRLGMAVGGEDTALDAKGVTDLANDIESRVRSFAEWWTGRTAESLGEPELHVHRVGAIVAPMIGTPMKKVDTKAAQVCAVVQVSEPHVTTTHLWPIEIFEHDGRASNASLREGEMLLYECQSVISGRPFELEPDVLYGAALHLAFTVGDKSQAHHPSPQGAEGSTKFHTAAAFGHIEEIKDLIEAGEGSERQHHLAGDVNDWQPLHEAARGGHIEVVKLLIDKGADPRARTNGGRGKTAHGLAVETLGAGHELVAFFQSIGAEL